jgi:hypothetical protein
MRNLKERKLAIPFYELWHSVRSHGSDNVSESSDGADLPLSRRSNQEMNCELVI